MRASASAICGAGPPDEGRRDDAGRWAPRLLRRKLASSRNPFAAAGRVNHGSDDNQTKRLEALDIACDGLHHIRQGYDAFASYFLEQLKALKQPAILFRRKIYVAGPSHKDAIDAAFAGISQHQVHRIYNRVMDGKVDIVFGFALDDGSEFEASSMQSARKLMYGFTS